MTKRNPQQGTRADKAGVRRRRSTDDLPVGKGKTPSPDRDADRKTQLTEDRTGSQDATAPGQQPVGATSSANSVSSDPFARNKALGEPVPQVTRHI